jgi:hypothetical protein
MYSHSLSRVLGKSLQSACQSAHGRAPPLRPSARCSRRYKRLLQRRIPGRPQGVKVPGRSNPSPPGHPTPPHQILDMLYSFLTIRSRCPGTNCGKERLNKICSASRPNFSPWASGRQNVAVRVVLSSRHTPGTGRPASGPAGAPIRQRGKPRTGTGIAILEVDQSPCDAVPWQTRSLHKQRFPGKVNQSLPSHAAS